MNHPSLFSFSSITLIHQIYYLFCFFVCLCAKVHARICTTLRPYMCCLAVPKTSIIVCVLSAACCPSYPGTSIPPNSTALAIIATHWWRCRQRTTLSAGYCVFVCLKKCLVCKNCNRYVMLTFRTYLMCLYIRWFCCDKSS